MWWILLLSYWSCTSWSMTRYPPIALNMMLGEQIDLASAINVTYTPDWRNTGNNRVNDAVDGPESVDLIKSAPANSIDRDRELLDEVERIEPRQWPGRSDILPTRSTVSTETSLLPKSPQSTTLAQKNPTRQRYFFV